MNRSAHCRFGHLPVVGGQGGRCIAVVLMAVGGIGCRSSELLTVPPPANVVSGAQLSDSAGAEVLRVGAIGEFANALMSGGGATVYGAMLTDEIRVGYVYTTQLTAVDARSLAIGPNGHTLFDQPYTGLQAARVQALQAIAALEQHPTANAPAEIGELFALVGYSELLLGEDVCSGSPISEVSPAGIVTYGQPLSTDSMFGRALAHFDSADVHGMTSVANLIVVGRGRALLNLGRFTDAGAAASASPATFVYNIQEVNTQGSYYKYWAGYFSYFTVGDRKGGTGFDYVSAHDARMPTVLEGTTPLGLPLYYPLKFPINVTANDPVPLADGVEAQLIVAEAALHGGDVPTWLNTLNQLRASFVALRGPYPADTSYHVLAPLSDPGSDSARVSLTFRERAFWLYGTDHRLGDLRRLIRQYGRDQAAVFPSGPYDNGTASAFYGSYGTSVSFPIGAIESGNPNFHGCSSTQA